MSGGLPDDAKAEPNLTPILDMVFQLITFFMLVCNFKAAELDMSLKLPVVGSAAPVDTKGKEELLVLNIDKEGAISVFGVKKREREVESYIAGEAQASLIAARRDKPGMKYGDELPTRVVIRADEAIRFNLLNRVLKACQDSGFRNFALRAMGRVK
jgi:biopolymer transport protein ExbD